MEQKQLLPKKTPCGLPDCKCGPRIDKLEKALETISITDVEWFLKRSNGDSSIMAGAVRDFRRIARNALKR